MQIAIIIVGHNSERWLGACLKSLRHAEPQGRVVYVDNASTDGSVQLVKAWNDVAIVQNARNVGFGEACNIGARHAIRDGADVLFFLNPDTRVSATTIERCGAAVFARADLGMVGPLQIEYGSRSTPCFNRWTRRAVRCADVYPVEHLRVDPVDEAEFREWLALQDDLIDVWYVNGGAFAIRSNVFEACGGFDPGYFLFFEEVELARRLRWLGLRAAVLPDAVVEHAWGGHSSAERLHEWTRSKYRFLLTDPTLSRMQCARFVLANLARDARISVTTRSSARAALAAVGALAYRGSALRLARLGSRDVYSAARG